MISNTKYDLAWHRNKVGQLTVHNYNVGGRIKTAVLTDICIDNSFVSCVHIVDGVVHNQNGPSVVYPGGESYWYVDGYSHRDDGPAVYNPTCILEEDTIMWYLNDTRYSFTIWCELTKKTEEEILFLQLKYNPGD